MNIEAIILDLDGPLLEGRQRHYQCYADILLKFGAKPIALEQYWQKKRATVSRLDLLQLSGVAERYNDFLESWLANIESQHYLILDELQYQVLEILAGLKKSGLQLILATLRHNQANLFWQLGRLGLLPYFDHIITVTTGAEKAKKVAEAIAPIDLEKVLWIGDTEVDVMAARELKIKVCALSCGLRDVEFLQKLQPDYLAQDLYSFVAENFGLVFGELASRVPQQQDPDVPTMREVYDC